MGQAEVLQFLQQNKGKKFTTEDIAERFESKQKNIYKQLMKLARFKFIKVVYSDIYVPKTKSKKIQQWYTS